MTHLNADGRKTLEELKKAAEQGNAEAQYNLGELYYKGQGVEQDYVQAAGWYQKAAEQGDEEAQFKMGYMHARGEGVTGDYNEAVAWISKAAKQGHTEAEEYLSSINFYS